jgi:hypothetical protein
MCLMFGRRPAQFIVFDVLRSEGRDMGRLPLWRRKVALARLASEHGLIMVDSIAGEGRALFRAVCDADVEGIVAQRRSDAYGASATWFKIGNPAYSQTERRGDFAPPAFIRLELPLETHFQRHPFEQSAVSLPRSAQAMSRDQAGRVLGYPQHYKCR